MRFLFIGVLICATQTVAEEGARLRGQVVDSELVAIPNASIRAMPSATRETIYRSQSGSNGSFHFDNVKPGMYAVAVSAPGFRERFIDNVVVKAGREVDLGAVRLLLAGCDAPGIICDSVSDKPLTDTTFSSGGIKVPIEACTVDIDKGQCICTVVLDGPPATTPLSDDTSDFWVHLRSDKHVYLEPRNGARLAEPNSAEADCRGAVFLDRSVRIDGLGLGSDLCLRSNEGRYSHIYFMAEVNYNSPQIMLSYVTRK